MKQILIFISLFLAIVCNINAQSITANQFNGRLQMTTVSNVSDSTWSITGYFTNSVNKYTTTQVAVNDKFFCQIGANTYVGRISVINSASDVTKLITFRVICNYPNPPNNIGAIVRATSNGYPVFVDGLPNALQAGIQNYFATLINTNAAGNPCERTITKTGHGFVPGTPLRWNGSAYVRPTVDSLVPDLIVVEVLTANTFIVSTCGIYPSALPDGLYWYTSAAPGYSLTQDTVKVPLFQVLRDTMMLNPIVGFNLMAGSGEGDVTRDELADSTAAIRADFPSGGGDLQTTTSSGDSTNLRLKVVKSNSRFIVSDSIAWYKRFISTTGLEGIVLENIRTEKYGNVYTSPYTGTTYRMGEWNRFLTRNWYNPGANRPGEVLTMDSYNASRSGGRLLTDEASWANVFESHYEQNRDQFEYYQQVILRDGYSFRPLSMYIGKKDSTNDARFQAHIFHVTPVGIEADMLNLKNGSLQIVRQSTAPPATLGQTWTEIVMAESTGSGNTFTTSNTGSGGVTFTQTATNATFNFNKTILGGTNVNIGASGGAMGKAFLTDLRITTPATVTSYPQFTLRLDDANNDVVKQKSSLIGTNASEDLIFYNSGNIRGTIDLLGKYYFGVTSERVATDAFLDVQGHHQTSTTGPPTSGTNSKAILRLSSRITTAVLDMGLSSNAHSYIQSTLSGNLASNRELRLNPNGGNVAIGNSTTDNSLYRLFVNGALGANTASIGTGVSPTAKLHLGAGSAGASNSPLKFTSGTNLTTPEAGAIEYDGTEFYATNSTASRTILARVLKGSATLDFGSTAAGASTDLTITVTGAADGDAVSLGVPNASVTATGRYFAWVSATNTVTVRFSPTTLVGSEDPASGTFKVTVTK